MKFGCLLDRGRKVTRVLHVEFIREIVDRCIEKHPLDDRLCPYPDDEAGGGSHHYPAAPL